MNIIKTIVFININCQSIRRQSHTENVLFYAAFAPKFRAKSCAQKAQTNAIQCPKRSDTKRPISTYFYLEKNTCDNQTYAQKPQSDNKKRIYKSQICHKTIVAKSKMSKRITFFYAHAKSNPERSQNDKCNDTEKENKRFCNQFQDINNAVENLPDERKTVSNSSFGTCICTIRLARSALDIVRNIVKFFFYYLCDIFNIDGFATHCQTVGRALRLW